MNPKEENGVGRFTIDFQVANAGDVIKAREGSLSEDKIRRMTIRGVVDSGAARLVLPKAVVKKLGLPPGRQSQSALCRQPDADARYG